MTNILEMYIWQGKCICPCQSRPVVIICVVGIQPYTIWEALRSAVLVSWAPGRERLCLLCKSTIVPLWQWVPVSASRMLRKRRCEWDTFFPDAPRHAAGQLSGRQQSQFVAAIGLKGERHIWRHGQRKRVDEMARACAGTPSCFWSFAPNESGTFFFCILFKQPSFNCIWTRFYFCFRIWLSLH